MLVPHLLKIYFGLGWPSSVLEIASVTLRQMVWKYGKCKKFENKAPEVFKKKTLKFRGLGN